MPMMGLSVAPDIGTADIEDGNLENAPPISVVAWITHTRLPSGTPDKPAALTESLGSRSAQR